MRVVEVADVSNVWERHFEEIVTLRAKFSGILEGKFTGRIEMLQTYSNLIDLEWSYGSLWLSLRGSLINLGFNGCFLHT